MLATVVASWQPRFSMPPTSEQFAPLVPAAAASTSPPPRSGGLPPGLNAWFRDTTTVISLPSFAGQLIADPPPVRTLVTQAIIRRAWEPPFFQSQGYGEIAANVPAPVVPSQPPIPGRQNLAIVRASWQPPYFHVQGYTEIAPTVPAPIAADAPPQQSMASLTLVLRAWEPRHFQAQGYGEQAAFLTVDTTPPPPNRAALRVIVDSWSQPSIVLKSARIAHLSEPVVVVTPESRNSFSIRTPRTRFVVKKI